MISDNRKDNYINRKFICANCGSEQEFVHHKTFEDFNHELDGMAYCYDGFCYNCRKNVEVYIDKQTHEIYTSRIDYFKKFPERYDLKKYLGFLVDRLDWIKSKSEKIYKNPMLKMDESVRKEIAEINKMTDFRIIDTFSFMHELLLDKNDKKYIVDIKKIENEE